MDNREDEKGLANYREDTVSIEVTFPTAVNFSADHQRRLVGLIDEICEGYEARHPERVMWAAGIGGKMLTNPFMVDDDHPLEFDISAFTIECFERENYDYPSPPQDDPTSRQPAADRPDEPFAQGQSHD